MTWLIRRPIQDSTHFLHQNIREKWLLEQVRGWADATLPTDHILGVARHEYNVQARAPAAEFFRQPTAIHHRHHDVCYEEIHFPDVLAKLAYGVGAVGGFPDAIPGSG